MKITPLTGPAQGTIPTATITSDSGAGSDRIARAMAAMSGSEMPAQTAPETTQEKPNVQKIKMVTNKTPINAPIQLSETPETGDTSAKSESVQEPNEATKRLNPQFAALAKAKRAAAAKEAAIVAKEQALAKQEADMKVAFDKLNRLKANPLSVLQEEGITYDQLTEAILNGNTSNPEIESLKNEFKTMKEELLNAQTQRDQLQEQQALRQLNREVENLVSQGDEFETIREAGYAPKVVELIHRMFKETGEIMETQEAAKLIEEELVNEALNFAKLKKIQSRIPQLSQPQPQQQPRTTQMKTLTNRHGTSAPLTARERAIAAFYGQLK